MKYTRSAIFLITVLVLTGLSAFAQENEAKVIDEVVAQVNDGVITLSRIKREMKAAADSFVAENKKTPEQAKADVEGKQGELIANIINEELLLQKGKELNGIESDVQAQINQRFLGFMKQQNLKTLDALYKEMEKANVNPDELRETLRKQATRDAVFQREVDSRVYGSFTSKDIKSYYEANKAKFTKPETVTISEIFLGFAGRDEAAVKEKAKQIAAQAKSGADFGKLAEENSDRPDSKTNKGKAGTFNLKDMDERFIKPLQGVKAGGVTEPIEIEEGMEILRVDARTQASGESFFDENEVRKTMTYEKLPEERKKYMANLRNESYIKINDTYRPMVAPILFANDKKAEAKKPSK
ncbi:MAG TPA: peptidylprolyl isomerase [Pyrinomonadaceae bacterium]|nr:peptidylprolyl isomerase [Pyrinomonadaceae bacterium]